MNDTVRGVCGQYPPPRLPATEQLERQLRELLPVLMACPGVTPDQIITLVMRCARPLLEDDQPAKATREQDKPDSAAC